MARDRGRIAASPPAATTIASFHGLCRVVTPICEPWPKHASGRASGVAPRQATRVHPILFTNADLPPHRQFEAFRAAHEPIVDIGPIADAQTSFAVTQRTWPLGRLVLTTTHLPRKGHPVRWRHLRKGVLDHWYVVLPCGTDGVPPATLRSKVPPLIHSLARPLDTQIADDAALTLFVPRDFLAGSCLDTLLDVPLDNGLGALLGDLMLALDRRLPLVEPHELDCITEAARSFLDACAIPSRGRLAEARAPIDLALLERARRQIRFRLTEPGLSPDTICRDLGVSRSRLYRLFEPLGGISAYIRRQRLLAARHALIDPFDTRPITRIAEHWAFTDASVFSRAFRQEFGLSPKEARETGRTGSRGAADTGSAATAAGSTPNLAELLHRLAG